VNAPTAVNSRRRGSDNTESGEASAQTLPSMPEAVRAFERTMEISCKPVPCIGTSASSRSLQVIGAISLRRDSDCATVQPLLPAPAIPRQAQARDAAPPDQPACRSQAGLAQPVEWSRQAGSARAAGSIRSEGRQARASRSQGPETHCRAGAARVRSGMTAPVLRLAARCESLPMDPVGRSTRSAAASAAQWV